MATMIYSEYHETMVNKGFIEKRIIHYIDGTTKLSNNYTIFEWCEEDLLYWGDNEDWYDTDVLPKPYKTYTLNDKIDYIEQVFEWL